MDIFTDYANWKLEKYDLITTLKELESNIIKRYENVLLVLDYLYDIVVEKKRPLTEDEKVIFGTGFEYLDNNFITIEELLKNNFNNNIKEMENCSKTVNLFLYTLDFEDELLNLAPDDDLTLKADLAKLEDFEEEVNTYLNNKADVDDAMFVKLDELTEAIFTKRNLEVNPIDSIFYQIAETYNLIASEHDVYNDYINEMINHDKTCHHEGH